MNDLRHVVRYSGPFGFIKPWTAVRDTETFSQPFLTPSIVEGMRQKLEVSAILGHRLRYGGIQLQQEQTQPLAWTEKDRGRVWTRPRSIISRGTLISPLLWLAFGTVEDAENAASQHLCLCRNEDLVYPEGEPVSMTAEEFETLPGVELLFGSGPEAFFVGYNRFLPGEPMYGTLRIVGDPLLGGGEDLA